jgi:amino acid transporter
MGKDLQRDLGLYAVTTISIGAMIGSGIFVLPGLASKIAGPAVILAYPLAGLVVLPAAIAKAEMATAMPESGGTYLYIDRAMGPLMGTIAGVGAWFSLVFKSAFALVGLTAYLLLFMPGVPSVPVALLLATLLVTVNIVGVKQTGGLQAFIVTGVLLVLGLFILDGMTYVQAARFRPGFFAKGTMGLLEATGFIFVSYGGVTKIASVAEEVEDPSRNIPLAMIISVLIMMAVYTLVAFVIVGVSDPKIIAESTTPMADAASAFLGPVLGDLGTGFVAATAVAALTSMANAGILASSRYPFAMSRDKLAPDVLAGVSSRFSTPVASIIVTGTVLAALVAFIPVRELAKLASAFKILVFTVVIVAQVAFRETQPESYEPEWVGPGYPWVPAFGIVGGVVLLTTMGKIPLAGAGAIVLGGTLFYFGYGRSRVQREGVGLEAIRRERKSQALEETEAVIGSEDLTVLLPVAPRIQDDRLQGLLRLGADLAADRGGRIRLVAFEEVPDQMPLSAAREQGVGVEEPFEDRARRVADDLGVEAEIGGIVTHDLDRAIGSYIEDEGVDIALGDAQNLPSTRLGLGEIAAWMVREAPCEVILLDHGDIPPAIDTVAVTSDGGPFDAEKVRTADALAMVNDAKLSFVHLVGEDAADTQVETVIEYHGNLGDLVDVSHDSQVVRGRTNPDRIREALAEADLVVTEASEYAPDDPGIRESAELVSNAVGIPVLLVYPRDRRRAGFLRRLVDRVLYR